MNHNDSTLIEPIEFFRNRYAPRFPELNALVFPVISPETRAPGKYIITGSGEREFLPDIICHRQFIISKIQDKTVIPSQSLIDTLKINQWELDPMPYFTPPQAESVCTAFEQITPVSGASFDSNPDAIDLSKWLIYNGIFRMSENRVYFLDGNHYAEVPEYKVMQILRTLFADIIENPTTASPRSRRSSNICKDVMDELKRSLKAEIRSEEISYSTIAFRNGYVDLEKYLKGEPYFYYGERPRKVLFYSIEANFLNQGEFCSTPGFDSYLYDVTGGDGDLILRIWEIIGYCLTQDTYRKCCFVFQGVPNSGKSTLERLIKSLFSKGSVNDFRSSALSDRFALADFDKKALGILSDLPDKPFSEEAESMIKQLTGLDEIDTDVKFQRRKSFYNRAKLLLFTNNPIVTRSLHSEAFFNRLVAVPFRYKVVPKMSDMEFDCVLANERDGIATKALHIYLRRYGEPCFLGDYRINEVFARGNGEAAMTMRVAHMSWIILRFPMADWSLYPRHTTTSSAKTALPLICFTSTPSRRCSAKQQASSSEPATARLSAPAGMICSPV